MDLLIVEDNKVLQDVTARLACRYQFKPTVVDSAQDAIEAFGPRFRLVITDFHMPPCHLTGADVVRHVKARAPHVTCVIATADDILCPEADMVWRKPFNYKHLFMHLSGTLRT